MVIQVGLVLITILYHVSILGQTLPRVAFTNLYHRTEGITHSGRDYVLCGVITCDTIVLMWLRQALV